MSLSRSTCALLALLLPFAGSAQSTYQDPPAPIARMLDAEPTPAAGISPDRRWLLLLERVGLPPISEVAEPWYGLAGDRINPRNNARAREITYKGMVLRSVDGNVERRVVLPAGVKAAFPQWSPDGSSIAFINIAPDGATLWIADARSGQARQAANVRLNGTTGVPCAWHPRGDRLLCRTVLDSRGAPPERNEVPTGPIIQENDGRTAPNRTYQDLLTSAFDEKLYEYYYTSRLAWITTAGDVTPIGEPRIHDVARPSPDGRFILVETIHRPYSYLVPMGRFPVRIEVLDAQGNLVRRVTDRALQEEIPTSFDAVETGPRNISWRADAPATLVWAEAQDDGDPAVQREVRDRVFMLAAPFSGTPVVLADLTMRYGGMTWGRSNFAVLDERWSKTRKTRSWVVDLSRPGSKPRLLWDRSSEDRYTAPGRIITEPDANGNNVIVFSPDGRSVYLAGQGASAEGDRPFLDRMDITSGRAERLWRSEAPFYEEVIALLDNRASRAITKRESVKDVPNYFVRSIPSGALAQLTSFKDPAPEFAGVTSQLVTYRRNDGVQLSATLYLPPGYRPDQGKLPFLLWAYPREFRSRAAAAQVVGSPYRFTRPSGASHLYALLGGYGILDGPTMPIIGEGTSEPNDTYVEQLTASAQAAIDKIVEMGVADRERIGIGGHSYGAFMTANLLAHSKAFRAGIARSGAYNRTLTPFGFQAEERTYWEAPEIYERMSPFTYAHHIKAPILLIHGMADDNSGTFPVQSERFYSALKGNGARVRYVQLPAEAHGYRARESIGHTLYEMLNWLDLYVKPGRGPVQ